MQDLQSCLQYVAQNKTDSILEDRYCTAIGHSSQREAVLRAFALNASPSAHTRVVYPVAEGMGVTNPSYYTGDLQKEQFGQEILKVNEQTYAFRDRLFQAYVAATPLRLAKANGAEESETARSTEERLDFLHFSDIHFGASHFFTELPAARDGIPAADKPSFARYVIKAIREDGLRPAAILISGDAVQSGLTAEFNLAVAAFREIGEAIVEAGGKEPVMIACPGNHDVNWKLGHGDPDAKHLPFAPYVTFRNSISRAAHFGSNVQPERLYEVGFVEGNPPAIVLSLNSATLESSADHRGYIGESQLDSALREVRSHPRWQESVRIAMFHHHLVPVSTVESTIAAESLLSDAAHVRKRLHAEQFSIVLHGHRHHGHAELNGDGSNTLLIIGCGSSGVTKNERGEQPLQFNRVSVSNRGGVTNVSLISYDFDPAERRWVASRSVPSRSFNV